MTSQSNHRNEDIKIEIPLLGSSQAVTGCQSGAQRTSGLGNSIQIPERCSSRARFEQEKARLEAKPTKNSVAYELYLKAGERNRVASTKEDGIAADQMYAQAIALDPTFALAYTRASLLNSRFYSVGRDPTRKVRAWTLAKEALRLAPTLGEAHLALGLSFQPTG